MVRMNEQHASIPGRYRQWLLRLRTHETVIMLARTLYYLAILAGLLLLYGKGDFSTPSFIYQGF